MSDAIEMRARGLSELRVGATYRVHHEDCCLQVTFTSRLISAIVEDGELLTAWHNGVIVKTLEKIRVGEVTPC